MGGGISFRLFNGTLERMDNGSLSSWSTGSLITQAFIAIKTDNTWDLVFVLQGWTYAFHLENIDTIDLSREHNDYCYIYEDQKNAYPTIVMLGDQPTTQTIADPIEGEAIPGMVGSMRFSSSFNSGTIQYTIDQINWITIDNASNLERSYMAVDGTMFNKSQDGITFTKVIPGQWLLLPTDAGMFGNVANNPGSVLLGIYTSASAGS
jgi:hypothetical protein